MGRALDGVGRVVNSDKIKYYIDRGLINEMGLLTLDY